MAYPPPLQPQYYTPSPNQLPAGMAIASMVCGIVSIPMVCIWYASLPLAIVAIVLGFTARRRIQRGEAGGAGMATAGIVCGFVTAAIIAIVVILFVVGMGALVLFSNNGHH